MNSKNNWKSLCIVTAALIVITIFAVQPGSAADTTFVSPIQNARVTQIQENGNKASIAERSNNKENMPLKGITIGLDPGHQAKANSAIEPNAPGSKKMKKKVSSGTRGIYTKVYEYQLNLQIGLMLKVKLEAKGAKVVMTRETNNINISNMERAKLMNENNADVFLRIHANGSKNKKIHGMFIIVPSKNGCLKGAQQKESERLAKALLQAATEKTGAQNRGLSYRNDETGNNWAKMPVCLIEMGFMTNKKEDIALNSKVYQEKLTDGLAEGFINYFKQS